MSIPSIDARDVPPKFDFTWYEHSDTFKISMDFTRMVQETYMEIQRLEEQSKLHVVVEYLRAKGFYILDQKDVLKK